VRQPDQLSLFDDSITVIETVRVRDRTITCSDGAWATYRARPPGDGWKLAIDGERWTKWTRRKPVWRPVRRRAGGWERR